MPGYKRKRTSPSTSRYRKRAKRAYVARRKSYRKRNPRFSRGKKLQRGRAIIPLRANATLGYVHFGSVSGTSIGGAFHTFRANSLFDPDVSGVGQKVYGWATYDKLYQQYRVISGTVYLTFANNQSVPVYVGIRHSNTNASEIDIDADLDTFLQTPGTSWRLLDHGNQSRRLQTLKFRFSVGTKKGASKGEVLYDADWSSPLNSSPPIQEYLKFYAFSFDGSSITWSSAYSVKIKYDTVFSERQIAVQTS